jgi:hypothetical protein
MDAIKIGVPGVLNLPQSLRHGGNDPHVRWTLIGLEDQLWGRATSIGGQIGMICMFQVSYFVWSSESAEKFSDVDF